MTPFYAAEIIKESGMKYEDALKLVPNISREAFEEASTTARQGECFKNDTYQVIRRELDPSEHGFRYRMVHLSIKRIDKECIHDWRDLQEIKNMLVGVQCEGFEIYPAERRLVDTANQYHLWVFLDPHAMMPIGFPGRLTNNESGGGAVQRPR